MNGSVARDPLCSKLFSITTMQFTTVFTPTLTLLITHLTFLFPVFCTFPRSDLLHFSFHFLYEPTRYCSIVGRKYHISRFTALRSYKFITHVGHKWVTNHSNLYRTVLPTLVCRRYTEVLDHCASLLRTNQHISISPMTGMRSGHEIYGPTSVICSRC